MRSELPRFAGNGRSRGMEGQSILIPVGDGAYLVKGDCKCCVVSYLMWKVGDYDLFYLESANVVDMTCDEAKSQPGVWPWYEGFTRQFLYFRWR